MVSLSLAPPTSVQLLQSPFELMSKDSLELNSFLDPISQEEEGQMVSPSSADVTVSSRPHLEQPSLSQIAMSQLLQAQQQQALQALQKGSSNHHPQQSAIEPLQFPFSLDQSSLLSLNASAAAIFSVPNPELTTFPGATSQAGDNDLLASYLFAGSASPNNQSQQLFYLPQPAGLPHSIAPYVSANGLQGQGSPSGLHCLYKKGRCCRNPRSLKRNGQLHSLCVYHRTKQVEYQRNFDRRNRVKKMEAAGSSGSIGSPSSDRGLAFSTSSNASPRLSAEPHELLSLRLSQDMSSSTTETTSLKRSSVDVNDPLTDKKAKVDNVEPMSGQDRFSLPQLHEPSGSTPSSNYPEQMSQDTLTLLLHDELL